MKSLFLAVLVTGTSVSLTACRDDDDDNVTPGTTTYNTLTDALAANTSNYSLFSSALRRAGLMDSVNRANITVFVPTNAAFQAAGFADEAAINNATQANLQRILRYHIVGSRVLPASFETTGNATANTSGNNALYITRNSGGNVFVNNARVTQTSLEGFTNAQVYVIDRVLMPPTGNLLQVAQADTSLSLLAAALRRAGTTVNNALTSTTTPITVFAPTNAAFRAAGYRDTTAINAATATALTDILVYHVIPGRVFSPSLTAGNVATQGGGNVAVAVSNNTISLTGAGNSNNAARIVRADIPATNGVIHVIDRVLLPR